LTDEAIRAALDSAGDPLEDPGTEEAGRLDAFEIAEDGTIDDCFDTTGAAYPGTEDAGRLCASEQGIEDKPTVKDAGSDFDETTGEESMRDGRMDDALMLDKEEISEGGATEVTATDEGLDETAGIRTDEIFGDEHGKLEWVGLDGFPIDEGPADGTTGSEDTGTADWIGLDDAKDTTN
jgi:hypothetical protein